MRILFCPCYFFRVLGLILVRVAVSCVLVHSSQSYGHIGQPRGWEMNHSLDRLDRDRIRIGPVCSIFCTSRRITFKYRLIAHTKCTGSVRCCHGYDTHVPDADTHFIHSLFNKYTSSQIFCEVNQYCSFVGSRTRTIILPLGTYPASLLYSE